MNHLFDSRAVISRIAHIRVGLELLEYRMDKEFVQILENLIQIELMNGVAYLRYLIQ